MYLHVHHSFSSAINWSQDYHTHETLKAEEVALQVIIFPVGQHPDIKKVVKP